MIIVEYYITGCLWRLGKWIKLISSRWKKNINRTNDTPVSQQAHWTPFIKRFNFNPRMDM